MPVYVYECPRNQCLVEVNHGIEETIRTWGELCFAAQIDLGDTDPGAPVRRVIRKAPGISVSTFNSELRNMGFTKLVKRDDGVYENLTRVDGEHRYMERGKPETMPDVRRKVED